MVHDRWMWTALLMGTCLALGDGRLCAQEELPPVVRAQAALDWLGISPGIIDGALGPQTVSALTVFQRVRGLRATGAIDTETTSRLLQAGGPRLVSSSLKPSDLRNLTRIPDDWRARARMKRLDHSTVLERLAERSHVTEEILADLNPGVDWNNLVPGRVIRLIDFSGCPTARADRVEVSLNARAVSVIGPGNRLIARFPCSIAANPDKRPTGTFQVTNVVHDPSYTFDPAVYPEAGLQKKLVIPPGPNNPVGTTWIGISKPGFGIHGTPAPEEVGRTGSHGCFRLTNWDADRLADMVRPGTPVLVEP